MSITLWIVGEPGAGKTTLVRRLTGAPEGFKLVPKPKWTVRDDGKVALAGHYTGATFDGADMVPYGGAAQAIQFWSAVLRPKAVLTIFDGDRFSNNNSRAAVGRPEAQLVVLVKPSRETAARRRAERGSKQDPSWVTGRATKSERFAEGFGRSLVLREGPVDELAQAVRSWLDSTTMKTEGVWR